MNHINLYKITVTAYNYYIDKVNNGQNVSKTLVQRKLTRNILLSKDEGKSECGNYQYYSYGNLWMVVDIAERTIIQLINYHVAIRDCSDFIKDETKYKMLNEIFGINELEKLSA